jgi:hypothetical protein
MLSSHAPHAGDGVIRPDLSDTFYLVVAYKPLSDPHLQLEHPFENFGAGFKREWTRHESTV